MKTYRAIDRLRIAAAGLTATFALAGCGGVQIKAEDHVPPPLVDELPLRAGVFYSPDFRTFAHREERWGTKWEVALGGAHVTKLDRLLQAMFPKLVQVPDLAKPPAPPLDLILEPRFEEYSFVTPRDAGAEYYAVTIKYRLNLYDGQARLLDSLVYTGYGNTPASGLSTEKPLLEATERAMRDAGAKFATEFAEQGTVQKLLRGETPEPLRSNATAASEGEIEEVGPPTGPPEPPAAPAPGGVGGAAPGASAGAAPGASTGAATGAAPSTPAGVPPGDSAAAPAGTTPAPASETPPETAPSTEAPAPSAATPTPPAESEPSSASSSGVSVPANESRPSSAPPPSESPPPSAAPPANETPAPSAPPAAPPPN